MDTNRFEHLAAWHLAKIFRWVRSVAMIGDQLSKWSYRFSRWLMPPTLHELRQEREASARLSELTRALEAGTCIGTLIGGESLKIESLEVVMQSIRFCGRCPLVMDPEAPRLPCPHKPAPPSLWQRTKYRFRQLLPVRIVTKAWEYTD